jgi:hypothetical protein
MSKAGLTRICRRLAVATGSQAVAKRLAPKLDGLLQLLIDSDAMARACVSRAAHKPYRLPAAGQPQLAQILSLVSQPPPAFRLQLKEASPAVRELIDILRDEARARGVRTLGNTGLTRGLRGKSLVMSDGTILGFGPYQDLDPEWLQALLDYLNTLVNPNDIRPFRPTESAAPYCKPLAGGSGPIRIALLGDWGTGPFDAGGYHPATNVMQTLTQFAPDYIVHLGDVYYSGEETGSPAHREESEKLVQMWPAMPPERSFSLNSNHEMYSGGQGYYGTALGRDPTVTTPFRHQNGLSYFALTGGSRAIVGLDSAYFDSSPMRMNGGLGSVSRDPQIDFLRDLAATHDKLILLTHHNPMATDGSKASGKLWQQIKALTRPGQVQVWYWGHVHLGILYAKTSLLGKAGIRAGCSGHGAIPIGDAWGLNAKPGISWRSCKLVGGAAPANRVKNGFALLTLTQDGGITEEFYDADNPIAVASRTGL